MFSVLCILETLDKVNPNACAYIRLFLPLTKEIVRDRFDVRFVRFEDLPYYVADIVVTQRTAITTLEMADQLISYCINTGARLIFDVDDDLLSLPGHHPERERYDEFKPAVSRLIASADEVWVSTQALADRYSDVARQTSVVPNQLDARVWNSACGDVVDPCRPVRFLYMGTSTHRHDFESLIKPALLQIKIEFHNDVELVLIGVANDVSSDGEWTVVHPPGEIGNSYPAFATWLQSLTGYDIGLAPLVDVGFNQCKSDVKWQEYSAMGLATIAADLPAYNNSIVHERTGWLAGADSDSFRDGMRRLVVDRELRQALKDNASRLARQRLLTSPAVEPRLERLLDLVRQSRPAGLQAASDRPLIAPDGFRRRTDGPTQWQPTFSGAGAELDEARKPPPTAPDVVNRGIDKRQTAKPGRPWSRVCRAAFRVLSSMSDVLVQWRRHRSQPVSDRTVLFDEGWYIARYPDVTAGGVDPFAHYIQVGATLGYDPHPMFDTNWYLAQNPDVAASGVNPLLHYVECGASEGRDPNPYFDTNWYIAQNSDATLGGMNPLRHYLEMGWEQGYEPSPSFDGRWYLISNPDVAAAKMNPLLHFLRFGASEGRAIRSAAHQPGTPRFFRTGPRDRLGHLTTRRDTSIGSIAVEEILEAGKPGPVVPKEFLVDVIVPVYRGLVETRRCLDSLLRSRPSNQFFGRLIIIDDCSPEPGIRSYLSALPNDGIVLLTNESNLGFVASVNRGFAASEHNDVVLLNSDTEVFGNWLDRLRAQGNGGNRIATVTPFSNNATICSYPDIGGTPDVPPGLSPEQIDLACKDANAGRAVDLPTGVGFCMLVMRAALDDVGGFDEATFGKGYGEEVDFCQRALERGWRHILAGDVFVFHVGATSFGDSSSRRKAAAAMLLRERHPTFESQVTRWVERDPAMPLRLSATAAIWRQSERPVVLHLLHTAGGGTEKHVAELIDDLAEAARHLVLMVHKGGEGFDFTLLISEQPTSRVVEFTASSMIDTVALLKLFGVSQVHVHHFLDFAAQLSGFLKCLGVHYDLSIHDYAAICPRINLVRKGETYCGEPDESACLSCLSAGGYKLSSDILWWRSLGTSIIGDAGRVLCPSFDTAQRVRRYVAAANIIVVPHEKQLYQPARAPTLTALEPGQPMRVAVLGVMEQHKGGTFFLNCVEAAMRCGAPIAWHVIGEFMPALNARAKALKGVLSVSGRYAIADLLKLVEQVKPHLLLFPQRWPETYSYTLSEAFAAGVPVLVPELGAFMERTERMPWRWTYPIDLPPESLINAIIDIRHQFERGEPRPGSTARVGTEAFTFDLDFYQHHYLYAMPSN